MAAGTLEEEGNSGEVQPGVDESQWGVEARPEEAVLGVVVEVAGPNLQPLVHPIHLRQSQGLRGVVAAVACDPVVVLEAEVVERPIEKACHWHQSHVIASSTETLR